MTESQTTELSEAMDERKLRCMGCGGWPINDGSVFVAVFQINDAKPRLGGMCELCFLKKLQKRGRIVNMTSSPSCQVDLPEIDIHKQTRGSRYAR